MRQNILLTDQDHYVMRYVRFGAVLFFIASAVLGAQDRIGLDIQIQSINLIENTGAGNEWTGFVSFENEYYTPVSSFKAVLEKNSNLTLTSIATEGQEEHMDTGLEEININFSITQISLGGRFTSTLK